jgi:hypothetical protein
VGIQAYLHGSRFFREKDISRCLVKARMGDLREYADGRIDRKTMLSRVQTTEN